MRIILLTNDDGILADGLIRLARAAQKHGEVWIVAPEQQMSAASHSLTLHQPIDIREYEFPVRGVHAFSCSGTPADSVRVGSLNILPEKPDIVLSGINYGHNVATDIQYSATVGAAFEASFQGFQAIAVSEGDGGLHEVTDHYLDLILSELIDHRLPYGQVWNVNFPDVPLSSCNGIQWNRTVSPAIVYEDRYEEESLPDGSRRFMVKGTFLEEAEEGTDFRALLDGYVSVGIVRNIGF